MTLKNDANFDEELTCCFKIDIKSLKNFDPSTRKANKFFKFFIMIIFTQNMQTKKNYIKKYKGLNLHYKHLLIIKAAQEINNFRCIYSSLQINKN